MSVPGWRNLVRKARGVWPMPDTHEPRNRHDRFSERTSVPGASGPFGGRTAKYLGGLLLVLLAAPALAQTPTPCTTLIRWFQPNDSPLITDWRLYQADVLAVGIPRALAVPEPEPSTFNVCGPPWMTGEELDLTLVAYASSTNLESARSNPWVPRTKTPTQAATRTSTSTGTATQTATHTATSTWTVTPTSTATSTPTRTATATSTRTATRTSTRTNTPTQTATDTATVTATVTDTRTVTATATSTPTSTSTETATSIPTSTATAPATATPVATPMPPVILCIGDRCVTLIQATPTP